STPFDHLLGWLAGADGRQAGLTYVDRDGQAHSTYPLAPDYQGCGHPDPDHSHQGGVIQYNGGACDGFLRSGESDRYAIGYYTAEDLPCLANGGAKYARIIRPYSEFLAECKHGRLPNVAFVDPLRTGSESGTSGDDHPFGDIRLGEEFLARTYNAVVGSPAWASTVLVI